MSDVSVRLAQIADRLDELDIERNQLFAERTQQWKAGLDDGLTPVVLAKLSRIKAVTVRSQLARHRDGRR